MDKRFERAIGETSCQCRCVTIAISCFCAYSILFLGLDPWLKIKIFAANLIKIVSRESDSAFRASCPYK